MVPSSCLQLACIRTWPFVALNLILNLRPFSWDHSEGIDVLLILVFFTKTALLSCTHWMLTKYPLNPLPLQSPVCPLPLQSCSSCLQTECLWAIFTLAVLVRASLGDLWLNFAPLSMFGFPGHLTLTRPSKSHSSNLVVRGSFPTITFALTGVAQWIEHQAVNQRVARAIPSQGTCLGCRPGSQ